MKAVGKSIDGAQSPIDIDELLARCVGRLDLLEKVLASFDEFLEPELCELERAIQSGDAASTRAIAHRLKGAALTVSGHPLSKCAERLEATASKEPPHDLMGCLEELRAECDRLTSTVRKHREGTNQ